MVVSAQIYLSDVSEFGCETIVSCVRLLGSPGTGIKAGD